MNKQAWALALMVVVAACQRESVLYCQMNPSAAECVGSIDAPRACASNDECSGGTPVCDTAGSMTCVQCLPEQAQACSGTTPTCGDDQSCRGCAAHTECAISNACLPDGACAAEGEVAYVGGPGATDNETCTMLVPCTKAMKALARGRPYVLFAGTTDEGSAVVVIEDQNVILLAKPGAKLTRTFDGIILEIKGTSQVTIYDLEISGGAGTTGTGVVLQLGGAPTVSLLRATIAGNSGGGVLAYGGSLKVSQSTISDNRRGGVYVREALFDLTNNFIVHNGNQTTSPFGGVHLSAAPGKRVAFRRAA
ncbi:MAG: right-handed parallel beta-helix repeat-containing protein [Kofleriaceae bacterium]